MGVTNWISEDDAGMVFIDLAGVHANLSDIRSDLASLTPTPDKGDTGAAWAALCPENDEDRQVLANVWVLLNETIEAVKAALE